jgi:ubiquinone biosynthesis protein UbiJ
MGQPPEGTPKSRLMMKPCSGLDGAPAQSQPAESGGHRPEWLSLGGRSFAVADEPINLVLEHLQAIRADMASLTAKVDHISSDQSVFRTEQRTQSRTLNILLQEGRMVRAAVNDLAKENVTPGEMEAVHEDLNRLRLEMDSVITRIEQLEERDENH